MIIGPEDDLPDMDSWDLPAESLEGLTRDLDQELVRQGVEAITAGEKPTFDTLDTIDVALVEDPAFVADEEVTLDVDEEEKQ